MVIEFDRDSATVRVDDAGLEALLDCAASPDTVGDPDAAMALASGRLDPAMGAIFNPEATVTVELAEGDRVLEHRIWVGERWAAYLLDAPQEGGLRRLLADGRAFLPASLALLVDLRPANADGAAAIKADPADLDALFAAEGPPHRGAALRAIGASRAWRITVSDAAVDAAWADGEAAGETSARRVVMSGGPDGVRLWDPVAQRFDPVTNTTAFRILTLAAPAAEL